MKELLQIKELAPRLKISCVTIRRLIKKREIPFHMIGKQYFFTENDIDTFLAKTAHTMRMDDNENT